MNAHPRKRTNVTLDAGLIERARAAGVNLSRAAETGVEAAVREAERARWIEENRAALDSSNEWVARNGLPLADVQVLKL